MAYVLPMVGAVVVVSVFIVLVRLLKTAQTEDRSRYNPNEGPDGGAGGV